MILGRGTAQTDAAVLAEYAAFLPTANPTLAPVMLQRLQGAPDVMQHRLGKPPSQWTDADILELYADRQKATWYPYTAFLAFLLFRGYRRATLTLLTRLPGDLARYFRPALAPLRTRLQEAQQQLGYPAEPVGSPLTLLIWLLALSGKPLTELTRPDFEAFRREYQTWYQTTRQRLDMHPNARLTRLERYLVHWDVLPPARPIFRHEAHFARLRSPLIRSAILAYMTWCDARYQPSSIHSHRAALLNFFLWLQDGQPELTRLDQVTRPVAIDYARH
jgi:hypothetical protein